MPKLTTLSIKTKSIESRIPSSIAPYLQQLASLAVNITSDITSLSWETVFCPDYDWQSLAGAPVASKTASPKPVSQTLVDFTTNKTLGGALVKLLIKAPALKHLTVGAVDDGLASHVNDDWAVERLKVNGNARVKSIARLPKNKSKKVELLVSGISSMDVHDEEVRT